MKSKPRCKKSSNYSKWKIDNDQTQSCVSISFNAWHQLVDKIDIAHHALIKYKLNPMVSCRENLSNCRTVMILGQVQMEITCRISAVWLGASTSRSVCLQNERVLCTRNQVGDSCVINRRRCNSRSLICISYVVYCRRWNRRPPQRQRSRVVILDHALSRIGRNWKRMSVHTTIRRRRAIGQVVNRYNAEIGPWNVK